MIGEGSLQKNKDTAKPKKLQFALASTAFGVPTEQLKYTYLHRLIIRSSMLAHQSVGIFGARLQFELAAGLAFNLMPVFLAIGISIYFNATAEPLFMALLFTAVFFVAMAASCELHGRVYLALAMAAAIFTGMLVAKVSVLRSPTSQIERQMTAEIAGTILSVDKNRNGSYRPVDQAELNCGCRPVAVAGTGKAFDYQPYFEILAGATSERNGQNSARGRPGIS